MPEELKQACEKIVKIAQERCDACYFEAHPEVKKPMTYLGHVCKEPIAAARDGMLAAVKQAKLRYATEPALSVVGAFDKTEATINELLGKEASDGSRG
jgi:hypothetical protein